MITAIARDWVFIVINQGLSFERVLQLPATSHESIPPINQPASDGFPEGFLDQRFERWVTRAIECIGALPINRFSITAKASSTKPVETG
jgi:hypothetical protein